MGQYTKDVTLGEVAEAIRLNGWQKVKTWTQLKDGKVVAACAIAQGAIRLGLSYSDLKAKLDTVSVLDETGKEWKLGDWIIHCNDTTEITVGELGYHVVRRVRGLTNLPLTVATSSYKT